MKLATIKIFADVNNPANLLATIKGPKGWRTRTASKAHYIADEYTAISTDKWWKETVDKPWRTKTLLNGAPIRYIKLAERRDRCYRRVLKLLKAKGLK